MDTLSGQYGFNTKTELKEAMYSTGKTKFGQGSARNEVLFGEDGLKAGATKEEFMDRIQEIGFDSDIANACWEVLNMDTDGDSADVIDEEEYNKLITMYGSDFNGEQIDELNEITVGSFYTLLNTPRDVYDSSFDSGVVVDNPSQPSVSPEASAAPEGETEDDNVNTRLITFMSNFINKVDELLTNSDTEFSDVINLAKHYNFSEYTDNPPTSAQEIEYRSQMVDKAISMYTYAETPDDISSLNDSTNLVDVIYASFDENDLREQKLTDLFTTISEVDLGNSAASIDWSEYDIIEALSIMSNGECTNADVKALFSEKGVEQIISKIMQYDINIQKEYLNGIMNSLLNIQNEANPLPSDPAALGTNRPASDDTPISDENAEIFANQLGQVGFLHSIDRSTLDKVLSDPNLSQEDIVKITKAFNKEYGSIAKALDSEFSGGLRTQYTNAITDILIEQAGLGNQDAINLLAKELRGATAEMLGTADDFTKRLFSADSEILGKVAQVYSTVNKDANILDDIKGDFSFSTQEDYVNKILNAISTIK